MNDTALAIENTLLKARLAETEAALADAVEAQRRLESIVDELRRERFGASSEKLDPEQFNLALEGEPSSRSPTVQAPLATVRGRWRTRSRKVSWRRRRRRPAGP